MLYTGDATPRPPRLLGPGDVAALYESCATRVHAFVYRRTGNSVLAEDITAQTFMRVLQAIGRYEDRGLPITAWLRRIAANEVAEHARRHAPTTTGVFASAELVACADPGPEEIIERHERALGLQAALSTLLAALTADQRRAVRLRYWEERPLAEIAGDLGRSEGATKALLHRAMARLRARVTTRGPIQAGPHEA